MFAKLQIHPEDYSSGAHLACYQGDPFSSGRLIHKTGLATEQATAKCMGNLKYVAVPNIARIPIRTDVPPAMWATGNEGL